MAERQSFTRASEELSISQSALSRSIARLEEELGQPVFERQPRRVVITDAGQLLQSRARQIIGLIEDTKSEISDDAQSGRIRLAAIPTVAPFMLPELLQRFAKSFPDATVIVQEDTTANLLKRCEQGEVDLGIVGLPIPSKYLEVEELFDEELYLVLPPDHPLNDKKRINASDIEPFDFILLDEAHCLTDDIMSFCHDQSFHPVTVEHTSQLATVQELVSLDHGVSLIPAMARYLDNSDRRKYRSLSGKPPTRRIAMVWNPYRFESKQLRQFKQELRQYTKRETKGVRPL